MNDDVLVPMRSYELVEMLDKTYPHRCKRLGEPDDEHQRYAGVRELLDELLGLIEEQEKTDEY